MQGLHVAGLLGGRIGCLLQATGAGTAGCTGAVQGGGLFGIAAYWRGRLHGAAVQLGAQCVGRASQ